MLKTLKKRSEFLALRSCGRFHADAFVIQGWLRQSAGSQAEAGFTVTRKCGTAVERNRIKRRLKHAVALATQSGDLEGQIVVVARRKALYEPFRKLRDDVASGIRRLSRNSTGRQGGEPRRNRDTVTPGPTISKNDG